MLIPQGLFTIREYDAVFTVTPTSRFDHRSDSVIGTVEMLVVNDQQEAIEFPFLVLNTDSGAGAKDRKSVEPRVLNGSEPVDLRDAEKGDIDENQLADLAVQRAQAGGVSDPAQLEEVRTWTRHVLARAERTKLGRTKIGPGQHRRIVLEQRIRVQPDASGKYTLEILAPSPVAALAAGGRVSVTVLLPFEDEDVRPLIEDFTREFEAEQGRIKGRQYLAWFWRYDPVFRLIYRYAG